MHDFFRLRHCSNGGRGIRFSSCPCVRPWTYTTRLLTRYLTNRSWEFHNNLQLRCS